MNNADDEGRECCHACRRLLNNGSKLNLNTVPSKWRDGHGCPYCDSFMWTKADWEQAREDYRKGLRFNPAPWPD